MTIQVISSTNNTKIKEIEKLHYHKHRITSGLFIIEGEKEIELAIKANYEIENFIICLEILSDNAKRISDPLPNKCIYITRHIFEKLAYRDNNYGLIAIAKSKSLNLKNINLSKNSLVLVIDNVEKPGNLGAILRTADAAGVDAVLICDLLTDIYNPNIIRASIGTLFTNNIVLCSIDEAYNLLKANNTKIYVSHLSSKKSYADLNMKESTSFIIGSENDGVRNKWLDIADETFIIPMYGNADSLNVSVSAALMLFEALKQRKQ